MALVFSARLPPWLSSSPLALRYDDDEEDEVSSILLSDSVTKTRFRRSHQIVTAHQTEIEDVGSPILRSSKPDMRFTILI
ncbi:hypothetical protein U1Q18_005776 [Sarracenia purpurea var. burkii]